MLELPAYLTPTIILKLGAINNMCIYTTFHADSDILDQDSAVL